MHTLDQTMTELADAAALLAVSDRITHCLAWIANMQAGRWVMVNDPMAEIYQAEATVWGIYAEMIGRGTPAPTIASSRLDPLGFLKDASHYLTRLQHRY